MKPLLTLKEASNDQSIWDRCQCGGRAVIGIFRVTEEYCAICDQCPEGTGGHDTPSEVVRAWNRLQRGFKEACE